MDTTGKLKDMNYKKLEHLSTYYQSLKNLDAEINKLDKLALQLINNNCEVEVNLTVKDLDRKKQDEKESVLESDGSLSYGDIPRMSDLFGFSSLMDKYKVKEDKSVSTHQISANTLTAIQVLGIAIQLKTEQRNDLVRKIKEIA